MIDDRYKQQRLEGARLIIEKAKEIALEAKVSLDKIKWDFSAPIVERDFHVLMIISGNRNIQERFSDESLADFPGKVGTEITVKKIKNMIHALNRK